MQNEKSRYGILDKLFSLAAVLALAASVAGCTATCKRIGNDRDDFMKREAKETGPQAEAIVPFAMANGLINEKVKAIKPIDFKIPGLGVLGDYFGKLSVAPKEVKLIPAADEHVGFDLTFDVLDKKSRVFTTSAQTEVKPEIDLETRKVVLKFGPEAMKKVKMKLSKGAKKDLGAHIYKRLPGAAKFFLSQKVVEQGAASAVESLMKNFYKVAKGPLLDKIEKKSRMEFTLPPIPLQKVSLSSFKENDGGLRLLVETGLPVRAGITPTDIKAAAPSKTNISARMSASTVSELVNWAIKEGHFPQRYDKKGKAKKDGAFRPGLDWVPGKKPMKIYLWDLDKPCMKLTMEADGSVEIKDGSVHFKAKDGEITDIEAHAFTKTGVWFYTLWKDAMKVNKKKSTQMKFEVAGKKMVSTVEKAALEKDELSLEMSLAEAPPEEAKKDEKKDEKKSK